MNKKYEEAGFVRENRPKTTVLARMDASRPCRAPRVRHFAQELLRCNHSWLIQLTAKVREGLRGVSPTIVGFNGSEFMAECFSETAFAYASIQLMEPGARRDPKHFDGGASLLHMGITVFGARMVHCWFDNADESQVFQQHPGSIYIGNMCAVEHKVEHHDEAWPQILYHAGGADSASDAPGLLIAVMLRTDVFRFARGRRLVGRPSPVDMYERVNGIVAEHLATEPFFIPYFATVLQQFPEVPRTRCKRKTRG